MKHILAVNPGSTSTKYKIFDLHKNLVAQHIFTLNQSKEEKDFLLSLVDIDKIVIRIVHGGDISKPSLLTLDVKQKIQEYSIFAPIHNVRALKVIQFLEKYFSQQDIYACFDTAFHTTIPTVNNTYAIPPKIAKKYKIKKYGFHGLAVASALDEFNKINIEKNHVSNKLIFVHLGGGCSVTAVREGQSFITSMGMTPVSGIPMTTRSGDVDPGFFDVLGQDGISVSEISTLLNNESGFYGLTGSKDTKDIFEKAECGDPASALAFNIFVSEIVQKIYSYAGLMNGVDAVIFSGGIGYGNKYLRKTITQKLGLLSLGENDIFAIDVDEEGKMFDLIAYL